MNKFTFNGLFIGVKIVPSFVALKIEFGRVGADTHLTPREVIRDFIELLDILCQNPDANVAELLQSVGGDALAPTAATDDTGTAGDDRNFAEFTI